MEPNGGCYIEEGTSIIRSSLVGKIVISEEPDQTKTKVAVVGKNPLKFASEGGIRREDIRLTELDKVILQECVSYRAASRTFQSGPVTSQSVASSSTKTPVLPLKSHLFAFLSQIDQPQL